MHRLIIASALILTLSGMVIADELPRIKTANGTLVSPDGRPLRGATFFVDLFGVQDMRDNEAKYREYFQSCLLYTSPSPRDATLSRMPSSA